MIIEAFKVYGWTHLCLERKDNRMMVGTLGNGYYLYWMTGDLQASGKGRKDNGHHNTQNSGYHSNQK